MELPVHASSAFDSGNGTFAKAPHEVSPGVWQVDAELQKEPFTHGTDKRSHSQWFYFRVSNTAGRTIRCSITNAGESSYAHAWSGYQTACSYDREFWFRCQSTKYEQGALQWELQVPLSKDTVWFAYWAPYTYEQHQKIVARCSCSPYSRVSVIGTTCDGRPIDMVTIGSGPLNIWVTARLHPGESMGGYSAEGLLLRLLDPDEAVGQKLLKMATVRVVPHVNPDGAIRGHLRTNAKGANLNREWADKEDGSHRAPCPERSPEVYHVLRAMDAYGCDALVDIHGDEYIAANFVVTGMGAPKFDDRLEALADFFKKSLRAANPDFQLDLDYSKPTPTSPRDHNQPKMLNTSSGAVTQRYGCLAVTLEMPFKDSTSDTPEPICQWSPPRAFNLGRSLVDALCAAAPHLRSAAPAPRL
eukprot:TRINITY_DN12297_c0_g1_i2.p2 TRINITY_DN12297_c0_g1~~TRINITY_DN12297_c0_g1_i2.p2  ORF type:complete len:415 (+),score=123.53 TRINITY_DN12297_c0_g1_i2:92-1336(+)